MPDTKTALTGTTVGGMSAAALAPTVNWALHGFPMATMPESTPLFISAILLMAAHALYRRMTRETPVESTGGGNTAVPPTPTKE